MTKFCSSCGASNVDDAQFCSECGFPFKKAPTEDYGAPEQPPGYQALPSTYAHPNMIYKTYLSNEEVIVGSISSRCGAYIVDTAICLICCCPIGLIYWGFKDCMSEGRSIGKKMFNLRVIDSYTGEPCSPNQSLIRNFGNNCVITVFFDRHKRRIGDWLAHTIVIEDREVKK